MEICFHGPPALQGHHCGHHLHGFTPLWFSCLLSTGSASMHSWSPAASRCCFPSSWSVPAKLEDEGRMGWSYAAALFILICVYVVGYRHVHLVVGRHDMAGANGGVTPGDPVFGGERYSTPSCRRRRGFPSRRPARYGGSTCLIWGRVIRVDVLQVTDKLWKHSDNYILC